jgi:hypothetical protein
VASKIYDIPGDALDGLLFDGMAILSGGRLVRHSPKPDPTRYQGQRRRAVHASYRFIVDGKARRRFFRNQILYCPDFRGHAPHHRSPGRTLISARPASVTGSSSPPKFLDVQQSCCLTNLK